LATSTKPTDINGISSVADGINYAIPTQKELQTSISWLITQGRILKQGKNYELTFKGKIEYKKASKDTQILMSIWKNIKMNFNHYEGN
jgi:predicted transcriptional regulator